MKPSRLVTSGGVRRPTVRGMRKITKAALVGGAAAAAIAATVGMASPAQADAQSYFNTLEHNFNWVIWDYPGVLSQGNTVCQLLWDDVNPMSWLTYVVGYEPNAASHIIAASRIGLCPGNAVTR